MRVEETNALLKQSSVFRMLKRFDAKSPEGHFDEVVIFRFDSRDVINVPLPRHCPHPQRNCFLEDLWVPLDKNLTPLNVDNKCALSFRQGKC